jgi:pimeloyl-ACP methyl ester carboxylesterase
MTLLTRRPSAVTALCATAPVAASGRASVRSAPRAAMACGVMFVCLAIALVVPAGAAPPTKVGSNFSGLVEVGGGRKIYVECRGKGSPTVVLISGKGNGAADWHQVLDPADPVRNDPFDQVSAGQGNLHDSGQAVLPAIARTTRVCAYDRPDTRTTGTDRSTPRRQPHTLEADVKDLQQLLKAVRATKPYVLVAHSYGGIIGELYARTHPANVGGLVMVDGASSYIEKTVTAAKLAVWDRTNRMTSPGQPEGVELLDAFAKLDAAPPLPKLPVVVLSADKPFRTDLLPAADVAATVTFDDWINAQNLLASALDAEHVTATNSGHNVYLYSPQLVITAIRNVVGVVRETPRR